MNEIYRLEEVYEDPDRYLFVKNLDLAAAIKANGANLKDVRCKERQCVFVFPKNQRNLQRENSFKNHELTVDAKRILDERRFLVSEIKN